MSSITFNRLWEAAINDIAAALKIDMPQDLKQIPKTLPQFLKLFSAYILIYKKLEDSYDQILQPQKRLYAKKALEACIGRLLELKSWMVGLNEGKDVIRFRDILLELNMTPDALDVPIPRFLVSDRKFLLETREKFLMTTLDQNGMIPKPPVKPKPVFTMTEEEAIAIIQANERGRQGRAKVVELAKIKHNAEEELKAQKAGKESLSNEAAATRIQSVEISLTDKSARGMLDRIKVRASTEDELILLGMNNFGPKAHPDPMEQVKQTTERRKVLQLANKKTYDDAIVVTRQRLKDLEVQEMREVIQDKINAWLNANRLEETGFFPYLPKPAHGGSKDIIDPPLKLDMPMDDKKKKGAKVQENKTKKTKGGQLPPKRELKLPEDDDDDKPPSCPAFFPQHLQKAVDQYAELWHDRDDSLNVQQEHDTELLKSELRPQIFEEVRLQVDLGTKVILDNLKKKLAKEAKAAKRKYRKTLSKEDRKKFDADEKKKKKDAKDKKKKAAADKKKSSKDAPPPPPPKKKPPKRKKDLTANRSIESIFAELVKNGIIQDCPRRTFDEYVGCDSYIDESLNKDPDEGAPPPPKGRRAAAAKKPPPDKKPQEKKKRKKKADPIAVAKAKAELNNTRRKLANKDPSMKQAVRLVMEYCILPLSTEMVNEKAPFIKSVLLYGGPGCGKSLLIHAACRAAGATFINLSPSCTDGKYPGKKAAMMVHMAFKIARLMAPSVIHIDDMERIFVTDKKKMKAYKMGGLKDKCNRIKKHLLKELKQIYPGDRVMLIGATSRPHDCSSKKNPTKLSELQKMFTKKIFVPYPNYPSRMVVWRAVLEKQGAYLTHHFNMSMLALLTTDYGITSMENLAKIVLTDRRVRKARRIPLKAQELIAVLHKVNPIDPDYHQKLREWNTILPPPPDDKKKKGKKR